MTDLEKYFVCFMLRKAWDVWNEGEKAYTLKQFGLTENDVLSINLQMMRMSDLPTYRQMKGENIVIMEEA